MQMSFLFTIGGFFLCAGIWSAYEGDTFGAISFILLSIISIIFGIKKDMDEIRSGLKK